MSVRGKQYRNYKTNINVGIVPLRGGKLTGKSLEFTWYFGELPSQEALMRLVVRLNATLSPQINYFSLLTYDLKEKKAKFTESNFYKRAESGDIDYLYSCHFFSKQRGVDNRFPESSLVLSRTSPEGKADIYQLTLGVNEARCQDESDLVLNWNKIVQDELGWRHGFGCKRITFNLDFILGGRILLSSADASKAERISSSNVAKNLKYYHANLDIFGSVLETQCLLSVFRYNLVSQPLFGLIQRCFDKFEIETPGQALEVASGKVLWTMPNTDDRERAYEVLSEGGIVFDPFWFDVEAYVPTSSEFAIPS